MTYKDTYFLKIWDDSNPDIYGLGECALFHGLSAEDNSDYENTLQQLCINIRNDHYTDLTNFSSIRFGLETALLDLKNGGHRIIYQTKWVNGSCEIPINGLIWMGNKDIMLQRIKEKILNGFRCIKLKIGGIEFDQELELLKYLRNQFSAEILELRLDANGAFSSDNAMERLHQLAAYDIHSIEQPIKPKQWDALSHLSRHSPIPIALDEELIGLNNADEQAKMLDTILPQYIILKPALCGGFTGAENWIRLAQQRNINWWATSALESNIGLNAIAQWISTTNSTIPQGLGTGALYTNNITAPIIQERDVIKFDPQKKWEIPQLNWLL